MISIMGEDQTERAVQLHCPFLFYYLEFLFFFQIFITFAMV
ncbi:hypothetical protein Halhy_3862 [Haliscomenobacter hydrossis DSM 1100]|uniref:Uncharacterized protein n=1 Tax=Haliscomenobacter hydrossis (strain ATCC 27775 / DSM 1100 / LMG 10767 / O) TaxID=760192 RepID=F4L379_HALH1|nr:hypothetical protein Halhy_3862 [Haliscomenobacter hydrossis DSM 1100]